ncbi:predicted protein [Plenodomus lingam JN3]|uniref:Predicted protein n=1 Tax=Leptosphaeria maculans (strain JN3 / isolate v23.1.3 / race Av1-4-5-6-7-8) TaxID=985895 RepID=E4ZQC6_LEPMJ|nr:predicted protein [Plenodomus lingam JN3]CBX93601.1 predicted protein [Plenodomus lingam JN3]
MFQRPSNFEAQDAISVVESEGTSKPPLAVETMHSDMSHDTTNSRPSGQETKTIASKYEQQGPSFATQSRVYDSPPSASDPKEGEIQRLQRIVTQGKTTNKARETQLRVARQGLKNAREALDETFGEYTKVCEELKTVKQALLQDHQAIVYRKDIELFALRKINEQREKNLARRDAQFEEMETQHRATLQAKEEQLNLLKDRLAVWKLSGTLHEQEDIDHALQVRLLKVKKGRQSLDITQDKDQVISQLKEELAMAKKSNEAVVNQQAELKRAWDISKNIQIALQEERELNAQLREQWYSRYGGEANDKSNKEQGPGRLPTIEEDDNDKSELAAELDAAQKNNSELNKKVTVLEKRLRDVNARLFSTAQEAEALREQVRFEQARKHSLDNPRPSTIHKAQLDRLQAELEEARDLIAAKDSEIRRHKKSIANVDRYVGRLRREIAAAIRFHTEDQDEICSLRQRISELVNTEAHYTYHRRPRGNSPNHGMIESGRTTFARQSSPQPTGHTTRPRAHSISHGPSILSNTIINTGPETDSEQPKTFKRTGLGLRDRMKKMLQKDDMDVEDSGADPVKEAKVKQFDRSRMRNAFAHMTPDSMSRPATATVKSAPVNPGAEKPSRATAALPESMQPSGSDSTNVRYYAENNAQEDRRPRTATSKNVKAKRHRSWGAQVQ